MVMLDVVQRDNSTYFGGPERASEVSGDFLVCSGGVRRTIRGSLSVVHINGSGNVPRIATDECLPNTPFLLTDNLLLRCVFDGSAVVLDIARGRAVLDCDPGLPIVTPNWFGFAFGAGASTRLIAFAEHAMSTLDTEGAYSPDWEELPLKVIRAPIAVVVGR